MRPRILVIEPIHGDAIINALLFLKKAQQWHDVFIASVSCTYADQQRFSDLYTNIGMYFVPTWVEVEHIPIKYILPRIDYHHSFDDQVNIYRHFYPNVFASIYQNIRSSISQVNPDYILTSLGSLYIYNVFCVFLTKLVFDNTKILLYKDNPFCSINGFSSTNTYNKKAYKHMYNCPTTIQQKLYFCRKYDIYNLDTYPDVCSKTEVIYNG